MSFGDERRYLTAVWLLLLASVSWSQAPQDTTAPQEEQTPFTVRHADNFRQFKDSTGEALYRLEGNVDITRNEARILCGSLTYFPDRHHFLCLDSVRLTDPERSLYTDTLYYYMDNGRYYAQGGVGWESRGVSGLGDTGEYLRELGMMRLIGNASAEDSLRVIYSDMLEYESLSGLLRATGNVRMRDKKSGSTALASSAVYYRESGIVTLSGRPEVSYFETGDTSSAYKIVADLLRRYGPDSVTAVGRVYLWHDSLIVTADSLFHDLGSGISYFRGGPPRVVDPAFTLDGEAIDVQTSERKLRRVSAVGKARGEFHPDSTAARRDTATGPAPIGSWITGDTLNLAFGPAGIDSIASSGGSRSYFRENSQSSVNYLIGSRIVLVWEEGVISRVRVEGGGRGLFVVPDTSAAEPVDSGFPGNRPPIVRPRPR